MKQITASTITDDEILELRAMLGDEKIEGGTISDLCLCALSTSHPELRRRNRERCAEILSNGWKCYAKPAARGGVTCGHFNVKGIGFRGIECCEDCGCTKKASDDRRDKAMRLAS